MEAIEKAKQALRSHLLKNKDKVIKDLKKMREESEGNDITDYIDQLSSHPINKKK